MTERKQIEASLRCRERQQAALAQLGQHALECDSLNDLFDLTVEHLATELNVEFAKILELLPDGRELLLRAGVGWQPGLVGRATVSAGKESQAGYTLLYWQ